MTKDYDSYYDDIPECCCKGMEENEQLKKENDELSTLLKERETQLEELQAHVERLREALEFACAEDMWISNGEYNELFDYRYCDWYQDIGREVLNETPAQSLNHILSQVEEETIDMCILDLRIKEYLNRREIKRKYKEQSDET